MYTVNKLSSIIFLAAATKVFGATHLQQLIEKIGLEKTDVDAIVALPDDAKDFKPEDYVAKVNTNYENRFLNDNTFLGKIDIAKLPATLTKSIEAGQYGRFINEFKALATKQGIDLADLTEEEAKSLNKMGEKVFEKYKGKLGSPEAVQKLQADLSKALSEKAALETEAPTKLEEAKKGVRTEMQATIERLMAANELAAIKELKVRPALVVDGVMQAIRSKYTVTSTKDELVLTQKANPQLEVFDSAGKKITFKDALLAEAKELDLLNPEQKEGDEDKGGKGKHTVTVEGDEVSIPSFISNKINNKIKAESGSK